MIVYLFRSADLFPLTVLFLFLAFIKSTGVLNAQEVGIKAEVLVLGSYHMHNPGADVFNVKADDVLSEKRQAEIAQIIMDLKRFNPTIIALEVERGSPKDTLTQSEYQRFLKHDFQPDRWEGYQIGFRLARELGHETIYCIDEPGDFPFDVMLRYAEEHDQMEWIENQLQKMEAQVRAEETSMSENTIGQELIRINTPQHLAENHAIYVGSCQIGAGDAFPGTDVLTAWYKRNARIFTNFYRIAGNRSGERILAIFGAGHAHILRELIESVPDFRLIEPNDFLTGNTSEARAILVRHLKSVEDKDSITLKSTIHVGGKYRLILPDGTFMSTSSEFYEMHKNWFLEPGWTIEFEILEFSQTGHLANSTVAAVYKEADRNGKPYVHKMWITYVLEKIGDDWYVTSDHASTREKSE